MQKDNPACYECPKTKNTLHHWIIRDDTTAYCLKCNLSLTKEQSDDMKQEHLTPDSEMIERVANVLWNKLCPAPIRKTYLDAVFYKEVAVDVIKAMREPTDKMMIAMETTEPQLECFLGKDKSPSYLIWVAAVDSIFND